MIWLVAVLFPLVLALLLGIAPIRGMIARHGVWIAPLPALALAFWGGGMDPGFLPALFLGTSLHFGPYGQVFLLLAALLWTAAGVFAGSSAGSGSQQVRFALFFLLTLCGNLGLTVAQDLASFYVFFALMSFAAYGLIIHDRTPTALYAGRVYLTMAVIGEVILASGLYYAGVAGQSLLFGDISANLAAHDHAGLIFTLVFIGFGIKAGIIGLHIWLPLAHPAAPTAASAVLSGVMIKAGLLGWMQFFPLGAGLSHWGMTLALLGLIAAVYGVASGLTRHDPKTILAYSSVSQMGLMTMAFGFALLPGASEAESLISGLLLFVLVHGLAKASLFLGVGVAKSTARSSRQAPVVLAGLTLAGLILAGLPFTGGSLVKQSLKEGVGYLPQAWSGYFTAMLFVTAVGTMLLLAVLVWRVRETMAQGGKSAGIGMLGSWGAVAVLLLIAAPLLNTAFPEGPAAFTVSWLSIWDGIWPIALGMTAAAAFVRLNKGGVERRGLDDLVLAATDSALVRVLRAWRAGPLCDPSCGSINLVTWSDRLLQSQWMRTIPDMLERRLLYWHTVGLLFVALLLGFTVLAWWGMM
ncbi:Formate hydrogenlyase subunit 3/Multisubunit Na+/H+ antiporter, MnhD subunit [Desulfonatronum thiosulfatophilum]|uniref:Formate hydrogenlyase subunit 3/Multisubunit Na+/H+ antiporter, MnhD subunit n=1 Tax=Desulfonatronum thiosulfatophilum TaxID=617002 RepID=A0A1G6EPL1_9BACT|nr:complex I subunit 5 family protein [Desulfonatronum thiosulfatophilum]SDB59192.1 Formate hydrogenlyase subunit 3/Multisubunit Na+/H+ antiporter, MnhD subunit [Desulfonatronum thiosulfatophilum]